LTVGFHYENDSGSDCNLSTTETITDSDLPYNESFDPSDFSESLSSGCGSPADFDGVKVGFAPGSGFSTNGLVLSLLDEEDTEIASDNDASDGLSVSGTVSDNVDLPDDLTGGDGDDSGDTTAPSAPSGLSASAGDETVDLSWDAVSASDLDGYNVYRSTSSISDVSGVDPINGSPLQNTSYTDDEATVGTTFFYAVTAVDEDGNKSNLSNVVQKTPSLNRIAFARGENPNQIYTIRPDGTDLKQLTNFSDSDFPGSIVNVTNLTWAPDGSQIAFENTKTIFTIKPDGTGLTQLTDGDDQSPAWSP
jgi:hypothetical protein